MRNKAFVWVFKTICILAYLGLAFFLAATIVLLNIFGPIQALIPLGLAVWLIFTKVLTPAKIALHIVLAGISASLLIWIILNFKM